MVPYAKIGRHGEVRDRSGGEDDSAELVEHPRPFRQSKHPNNDDQVDEEHEGGDGPEPVGRMDRDV